MKKIITTTEAPKAIGPYSQGIVTLDNRLIFTAGQIPIDAKTGEMRNDSIAEATEQALSNVRAIVEAAGSSLENVVKVTVFMTDLAEFAEMNAAYERFFAKNPPSRSAIQVAALPKNARIEIEAIAVIKS